MRNPSISPSHLALAATPRARHILPGLALLAAAATLVGCGAGVIDTSSPQAPSLLPAIHGRVFGGQTPIVGAMVTLYTTGSTSNCGVGVSTTTCTANDSAYGVGTLLQEAIQVGGSAHQDTDSNGSFNFAGGYYCPANEDAYLVSAGGNTAANTAANPNLLLVAMLGRCEDLYSSSNGGGSGYTSVPTVVFTNAAGDTTGSGASATATISSGQIATVNVNNGGSGYTAPPTISFTSGGGSGGVAIPNMAIGGFRVTAAGSGYTSPTVTISGGGGAGATATAIAVGGAITGIAINTPGSGFTSAPTVTISDPTGTGASATASLTVLSVAVKSGYTGYAQGNIYLNELTTVASAYALNRFTTVSQATAGDPTTITVSIGAPSTNNAPQSGGYSVGTTTAAAGLYHAVLNALNLANPFSVTTLTTAPANPVGLAPSFTANTTATVPQPLLNSLGNSVVACSNSAGGAASDATGSSPTSCGLLFYYANKSSVTNAPTNTFSALLAIGADPTLGGSTTACNNLLAIPNAQQSAFSPTLTANTVAKDLSVAINFTQGSGATALRYPISLALDVNDNAYVGDQSASTGVSPTYIYAYNSNGLPSGVVSNSTMKNTLSVAVDALGNGYYGNGSGSSTNAVGLFTFTPASGSISAVSTSATATKAVSSANSIRAYAIAVDQSNNVWTAGFSSTAGSTAPDLYFAPAAVSSAYTAVAGSGNLNSQTALATTRFMQVAIDAAQNVWTAAAGTTTSSLLSVLPFSATPASKGGFTTTTTTGSSGSGNAGPLAGVTFCGSTSTICVASTSSLETVYTTAYTTNAGLQPFTATLTSGVVNAAPSPGTLNSYGGSSSGINGGYFTATDGLGYLWTASGQQLVKVNPAANTGTRFRSCLGTVSCAATANTIFNNNSVSLAIDSTGSIWITNPGGASFAQIIGAAAPSWPLLSLARYGQQP